MQQGCCCACWRTSSQTQGAVHTHHQAVGCGYSRAFGRTLPLRPDANGHRSPGRFTCNTSSDLGNFWEPNPLGASSPLPAPMGSYLSTSEPVAPAGPAQSAGCGVKPGALLRCRGTGAPPRRVTPRLWKRFPQAAPGSRPGAKCSWSPG